MSANTREQAILAEIEALEGRLGELHHELNELRVKPCGLKIGQRVRKGDGREYVVTSLIGCGYNIVNVHGKPVKKDGTVGLQRRWLGHADALTPVESNDKVL